MSNATATPVFLATTAIEKFWDCSKPIVFLGEWCCRFDRMHVWQPLSNAVLPSPLALPERAGDAYDRISACYEEVLTRLATQLNRLHGEQRSLRGWRLLIGPWLMWYLSALYDRYLHACAALDEFPGLATIGLAEESFVTPRDTDEFVALVAEDPYNLQMFTQIFSFLGLAMPRMVLDVQAVQAAAPQPRGFTERAKQLLRHGLHFVDRGMQVFSPLITKYSYFPAKVDYRLVWLTRGLAWPTRRSAVRVPDLALNRSMRQQLATALSDGSSDAFLRLVSHLLPFAIPRCFIEGHQWLGKTADHSYAKSPRAIFSANGWYGDEVFKRWAAEAAERGTLLMGTQHGGNYGSVKRMLLETHERAIVDRYYSWGWASADGNARVIPMPASKLVAYADYQSATGQCGILYVTTCEPRYTLQLPHTTEQFVGYMQWQSRFLQSLTSKSLGQLQLRPHYQDHGWSVVERLRQHMPDISVQDWRVPFQQALARCRLYVCDHLSTTFIEALVANKPTILFWDPTYNQVRPEAESCYDSLRSVGILHDTPEGAAWAIDAACTDLSAWWNEPDRVRARRDFCYEFGRTSTRALEEWTAEFRGLLKGDLQKARH